MMTVRSEIMKLRQRLARLLWRLHAIRNRHQQQADLSERLEEVLTEAGSIRGFLNITTVCICCSALSKSAPAGKLCTCYVFY